MIYPAPSEYAPYYHTYVGKISPDTDLAELLRSEFEKTHALLSSLSEEKQLYRYAPGKWSIREMVGHMVDTERVMAYRAMRVARGDKTPIPGFDQDDYIPEGDFDARPMASMLAEWRGLREATIAFTESLGKEASVFMGTASDNPVTPRALLYIIAGHELHHMGVLQERYL